MTNIEIVMAVLKLYNKSYLVGSDNDGDYLLIADDLCRKFFKMLNTRIEGLNFWYRIEPHHINSIIIRIIEGKQI